MNWYKIKYLTNLMPPDLESRLKTELYHHFLRSGKPSGFSIYISKPADDYSGKANSSSERYIYFSWTAAVLSEKYLKDFELAVCIKPNKEEVVHLVGHSAFPRTRFNPEY